MSCLLYTSDIDGRVYVLEVDLTALMAMAKPIYGVKEIGRAHV